MFMRRLFIVDGFVKSHMQTDLRFLGDRFFALYNILKDIPKAIHDKHVFLFDGKPINDFRTALRTACRVAGIPYGRETKDGFVFHDTRHCLYTNMRKSGVPESVIMKITGHSTREMFLLDMTPLTRRIH